MGVMPMKPTWQPIKLTDVRLAIYRGPKGKVMAVLVAKLPAIRTNGKRA